MATLRVRGGAPLYGHVSIGGSKNSALGDLGRGGIGRRGVHSWKTSPGTRIFLSCARSSKS